MKKEMKHWLVLLLLIFGCFLTGVAQDKVVFGEVPINDMTMTVYPDDTTAIAVVLYENCDMYYEYEIINGDFVVITRYTIRIKILKAAGLSIADRSVPFYATSNRDKSEKIFGISGYTYNMVNGKTERTKLSKEHMFEENTSENWKRIKIAFPNIKVGSVFELKYEKRSPYYHSLDDYFFQSSIPVRYSRYQITIPEYFQFSRRTFGYETIDYAEKMVNLSYTVNYGQILRCSGQEMTFVAANLPAMKDDSYVWNKNDYMAKVVFELSSFNVPGVIYKNYSVTWQDIDKQLLESERFGRQLRFSNLMKEELKIALKDSISAQDKATTILNLVKNKIQWNEKNTLYIDNARKALKEGTGTSGEMNAVLICLLQDAGFDAWPVVLSLRSRGRIFTAFPTLNSLNYFLVGVRIDGKAVYMDASDKYGTIDVLPTECMVQEARCIFQEKPAQWVDLHEIGKNGTTTVITAGFDEDGKFSGTLQKNMLGIPCVAYCRKVDKQKSVEDYQQEMENDLNVRIADLQQGKPQGPVVEETYAFTNDDIMLGDEYIYINSLIFPNVKENPFKAETRKLPIEYSYPYANTITVTITIPDGYEVEEIPAAERITMGDKQIVYAYLNQKNEKTIQVVQRIILTQTLYASTEYQHVRDFWSHIANINDAQIVLKRTSSQ